MKSRTMHVSFLLGLFLLALLPPHVPAAQTGWWDEAWSSRQELTLPSAINRNSAANQPVDTTIRFDSHCWARNETSHSVRVIFQNKDDALELESQLYEMKYSDEAHITSCNLVFLIPPQTDGTERYYVYFD